MQRYRKKAIDKLFKKIEERKYQIASVIVRRYYYLMDLKIDWRLSGDFANDPVINNYYNQLELLIECYE